MIGLGEEVGNSNLPSSSLMSTVAVGAMMSRSAIPPPEIICPKNLSVPSTKASLVIGTSITVSVLPGGNVIGMALA